MRTVLTLVAAALLVLSGTALAAEKPEKCFAGCGLTEKSCQKACKDDDCLGRCQEQKADCLTDCTAKPCREAYPKCKQGCEKKTGDAKKDCLETCQNNFKDCLGK